MNDTTNLPKPSDYAPVQVPPMHMDGPIEVTIKVMAKLGEKSGSLTFKMPPGVMPGRAEVKAILEGCRAGGDLPPDTRLMTKPEFVSYITKREQGVELVLPKDDEFKFELTDIPHDILVFAVAGAGAKQDEDELLAMSATELLALYDSLLEGQMKGLQG